MGDMPGRPRRPAIYHADVARYTRYRYRSQHTMEFVWRSAVLCLLVCALVVNGLYFHISETERKCFIEEVPAETMIVGKCGMTCIPIDALLCTFDTGKYKTQLYENNRQEWLPSSPGIGMHVEVSGVGILKSFRPVSSICQYRSGIHPKR